MPGKPVGITTAQCHILLAGNAGNRLRLIIIGSDSADLVGLYQEMSQKQVGFLLGVDAIRQILLVIGQEVLIDPPKP